MTVLRITEEIRKELSESGIIICTYTDVNGDEFDGITYEHSDDYPDLEVVEINISNFP
jgi:hypothetical protein